MAKLLWQIVLAACLCHLGEGALNGSVNGSANGTKTISEKDAEAGSASSVILLGGIGFLFAIYYMVNSRDDQVKCQTWSAISVAVSIFVAVMTNTMVNNLVHGEAKEEKEVFPSTVLKNVLQLIVWWFVICVTLFLQRASALRVHAYGVIGGHILGFAAIDTFAAVARLPTFKTSPWMTLLAFGIYIVAIHILSYPLKMMFSIIGKLSPKNKVNEEEIKACEDQAKDTSTDFYCMGASFLLAMWLRGLIMGEVVEKEAEAKDKHTTTQVVLLTLCGIFFLMLSGFVRSRQHKAKKKMAEVLETFGTTSSLASAWCMLDAANWFWLAKFTKDKAVGHVVVAIECSVIFVIAVILVSELLKRVGPDAKLTIKGEFTAIGLLLGLAWEHVFDAALEGAEPLLPKENKGISLAFITFVLVLIVFPAWVVYIVPKHDLGASTKVSDRELTPLHAFCDCGGNEVQEEELSEDEEEDEEKAAE